MYGIGSNLRWYNQLIKYPSRVRYLITLGTLFTLGSTWYLMMYRPIKRATYYYEHLNNQLNERYNVLKQDQLATEKLSVAINAYEKDLCGYKSDKQDANMVMRTLIEKANSAQVHLVNCSSESIVDRGWFSLQPINVTINGTLGHVAAYLQAISDSSSMCYFSQISLSKIDESMMRCQVLVSHMTLR